LLIQENLNHDDFRKGYKYVAAFANREIAGVFKFVVF